MKQVLGMALYCTLDSAEERPTMMEVAKQLRQMLRFAPLCFFKVVFG